MATINDRGIVDQIIAGDGWFEGDSTRVVKIVAYTNVFDKGVCYGLIYEGQPKDMYRETDFVRGPNTIWEAKDVTERPTFEEWMKKVDADLMLMCGLSHEDLPDHDFRTAYDCGDSPKMVVQDIVDEQEL